MSSFRPGKIITKLNESNGCFCTMFCIQKILLKMTSLVKWQLCSILLRQEAVSVCLGEFISLKATLLEQATVYADIIKEQRRITCAIIPTVYCTQFSQSLNELRIRNVFPLKPPTSYLVSHFVFFPPTQNKKTKPLMLYQNQNTELVNNQEDSVRKHN